MSAVIYFHLRGVMLNKRFKRYFQYVANDMIGKYEYTGPGERKYPRFCKVPLD